MSMSLSAPSQALSVPYFDVAFYLDSNPDVLAAVSLGQMTAFEHFVNHGAKEGRSPAALFDATAYLVAYSDVADAVGAGQIHSAWDHFVTHGVLEGRSNGTLSGGFDEAAYLEANPDVAAAVDAGGFRSGYEHFLLFGADEGRVGFTTDGVAIGQPAAQIFTLTSGVDAGPAFTGTSADDVFNAELNSAVFTELFVQTLNNRDNIDGGGGYNILNAQLVEAYTIPSGLTNIQEINLFGAPFENLEVSGFGGETLDLINANDVQVLGFEQMMGSRLGEDEIDILHVQSEVGEIHFHDVGFGSIGGEDAWVSVHVHYTGDVLAGESNALDITLQNADAELLLIHEDDEEEETEESYETINIASDGAHQNDLWLFGSAAAAEIINVSGDAALHLNHVDEDNQSIRDAVPDALSALDFDHLRTFNASNLNAHLDADFEGGDEDDLVDVSLTGAQGDTDFDLKYTGANLTVVTFGGDDHIHLDEHLGDVSINSGGGDDDITVDGIEDGDVSIVAGEGDNEIHVHDDNDAVINITAGAGDDIVELDGDRFVGSARGDGITIDLGGGQNTLAINGGLGNFNFDDADIRGVQTLEVVSQVQVPDGNYTIDIGGLNDLDHVVFAADAGTYTGNLTIKDVPNTMEVSFEGDWNIDGGLAIDDVVDLTVNIGSTTARADFDLKDGQLIADEMESLTINLLRDSHFHGVIGASGTDVNELTDVTVTGANQNAEFHMHFDTDQSAAIRTIDLSNFDGEAYIDLFEHPDDGVEHDRGEDDFGGISGFDQVTITMGSGDLYYGMHNHDTAGSDNNETFVFTKDFGLVVIDNFEDDEDVLDQDDNEDSIADLLDLSQLGITSAGQLRFTEVDNEEENNFYDRTYLSITARNGEFGGEIRLLGINDSDIEDVALFNIVFA